MAKDHIVAVGFLTRTNLVMLGERFSRCFSVEPDDAFDDLLRQLDTVEAAPLGYGVSLQIKRGD